MYNEEKQSEDLPKYRLRATAMKALLVSASRNGFSPQSSKLFSLFVSNDEARAFVFSFCQSTHPLPLISNIMNLLYDYFIKEKSVSQSESESNKMFQYFFDLVNKYLPSSFNKIDINSLTFIESIAKLASLFPSSISHYMSNIPTNQHQVAFLLYTLFYCDDISDYISQVQPLISPKMSMSTLTFSQLKLLSKYEEIENAPTVKTLISFCKSLPENELFSYAIPMLLCVVGNRLQAQFLKEIPAFITYLIKKVKKDAEHLPDLCVFIDKVLEFPDSINLIRPLHDDLVSFFITNAQLTDVEINDEIKDPTVCANKFIVKTFLNFTSKFEIDPIDCLMQTRDTSIDIMILAYSAVDAIPKERARNNSEDNIDANLEVNSSSSLLNSSIDNNSESKTSDKGKKHKRSDKSEKEIKKIDIDEIESFLNPLISQIKQSFSPSYQFLIRLCGICANKFLSKASLRFLVSAISIGSNVAYDYLINTEIPFNLIFPEIVKEFKPGRIDSLFIQALQVLLQSNLQSSESLPALVINEDEANKSGFDFDDPSIFAKLVYKKEDVLNLNKNEVEKTNDNENSDANSSQQLSGAPTDETILFCNIVSFITDFPEFLPLLGLSASIISRQFAISLIENIQKLQQKLPFNQCLLSAYSNSIGCLDINVVYNLALTFLMILPGQAMLYLGISLQRLPPEIILDSLQKVTPYAHSNLAIFGKMIALIAHSYPDIALSFTESFISSSATKRRVFFIFKTSETSEDTLIAVFNIIGYCSSFIESSSFINEFLPFSNSFMNKYLVSVPKSHEVVKSSLFAIYKMLTQVHNYQEKHEDFTFQQKDFLENYVMNILKSEVGKISKQLSSSNDNESNKRNNSSYFSSILLAFSSLIPLKPVQSVDKYKLIFESIPILIENSNEKSFEDILENIGNLYLKIIESNPTFDSILSISLSLFPTLLRHPNWIDIFQMINKMSDHRTKIKITSTIGVDFEQLNNKINIVIVNLFPLILTDECDKFASQILFDFVSLFVAYRNSKNDFFFDIEESRKTNKNCNFKTANKESNCKALINFISNQVPILQVFDIILKLLEYLKDEKVLETHHKNVIFTIKYFIEMKGIGEHQLDSEIVNSLISSIIKENQENKQLLFEIISIISRKNLNSILSVLVSQDSIINKQEAIFEEIIQNIIKDENISKYLIQYLSDSIYNPGKESEKIMLFANKTFPILGDKIKESDKEIWSKLFIGIVKETNSIESPLFQSLFKDEDNNDNNDDDSKKDLFFYAKETALQHPSALPLILSYFPEKVTPFIRKLSLILALNHNETSHSFLEYALNDLNGWDKEEVDILNLIFNTVANDKWNDLSQQITALIIDFIENNEINVDIDFTDLIKNKINQRTNKSKPKAGVNNDNDADVSSPVTNKSSKTKCKAKNTINFSNVLNSSDSKAKSNVSNDENNNMKDSLSENESNANNEKIDVAESESNVTKNKSKRSKAKEDKNKGDESICNVYGSENYFLNVAISFLQNVEEQGKKIFWERIVNRAQNSIPKYSRVFLLISFEVDISITSLIPIIPKLAVSINSISEVSLFLNQIYLQIESSSEQEETKVDDCKLNDNEIIVMSILKSRIFSQYKREFLNKFVDMMIAGDSVSECIFCISAYINQVDESNADVIEKLITELPRVNEADQKQISLMLQKVLI